MSSSPELQLLNLLV